MLAAAVYMWWRRTGDGGGGGCGGGGSNLFGSTFEALKAEDVLAADADDRRFPTELDANVIELVEIISAGEFGEVWRGELAADPSRQGQQQQHRRRSASPQGQHVDVAIRTAMPPQHTGNVLSSAMLCFGATNANAGSRHAAKLAALHANQIVDEALVMGSVGAHKNLVNLVGVVTASDPLMLVESFCLYGSLHELLLANAAGGGTRSGSVAQVSPQLLRSLFTEAGRLSMLYEVANGMAHLASKGIVHRDLRAKTVMVDSSLVCKVSDYGRNRDLAHKIESSGLRDDDYCWSTSGLGVFPVRSTAPEAVAQFKFSEASDVWSWAMLCVEVYTDAEVLFPTLSNEDVLTMVIQQQRSPDKPELCPVPVYRTMEQCWKPNAEERPRFTVVQALCKRGLGARPNTAAAVSGGGTTDASALMPTKHRMKARKVHDQAHTKDAKAARKQRKGKGKGKGKAKGCDDDWYDGVPAFASPGGAAGAGSNGKGEGSVTFFDAASGGGSGGGNADAAGDARFQEVIALVETAGSSTGGSRPKKASWGFGETGAGAGGGAPVVVGKVLRRASTDESWGFAIAAGTHGEDGLFVSTVVPASPGDLGGLVRGMKILSISRVSVKHIGSSRREAITIIQQSGLELELELEGDAEDDVGPNDSGGDDDGEGDSGNDSNDDDDDVLDFGGNGSTVASFA